MRNRGLLAIHRLEEFAEWAVSEGYVREETKDHYEVLRLRKADEPPIIFHLKDRAKQHATTWGKGIPLVRKWIKERDDA